MVPEQEADAAAGQRPGQNAHFSHAQQVAEDKIADRQHQRHRGKQAIQAIGEVDGIGKGNDGKHGKHIIEYPKIVSTNIGNGYHSRLRAADVQKQQVYRAKQNLQRHFLLFSQALILLFYDLQIVIEEANGPKQQRQHQTIEHPSPHNGRHGIAHSGTMHEQIGYHHRNGNADDKHKAAHSGGPLLALVPFGADL